MNPEDVAEAIASACEAASEAATASGFNNGVLVGAGAVAAVLLVGVVFVSQRAPKQAALPQPQARAVYPYAPALESYL